MLWFCKQYDSTGFCVNIISSCFLFYIMPIQKFIRFCSKVTEKLCLYTNCFLVFEVVIRLTHLIKRKFLSKRSQHNMKRIKYYDTLNSKMYDTFIYQFLMSITCLIYFCPPNFLQLSWTNIVWNLNFYHWWFPGEFQVTLLVLNECLVPWLPSIFVLRGASVQFTFLLRGSPIIPTRIYRSCNMELCGSINQISLKVHGKFIILHT